MSSHLARRQNDLQGKGRNQTCHRIQLSQTTARAHLQQAVLDGCCHLDGTLRRRALALERNGASRQSQCRPAILSCSEPCYHRKHAINSRFYGIYGVLTMRSFAAVYPRPFWKVRRQGASPQQGSSSSFCFPLKGVAVVRLDAKSFFLNAAARRNLLGRKKHLL